MKTYPCRDCGAPIAHTTTRGRPAVFCTNQCRDAYHRRRRDRGAELYDFVMSWRFERDKPDAMAQIARLASAYRDADKRLRAGRPSWDMDEARARLPLAFGQDGDRR